MDEVRIERVDERDSSWEDAGPRFRVYLYGSGPDATIGWADTYDVTGADVLQVIDWAQRQAGDALTYAVALVRDEAPGPDDRRGLVWLVGMDGNDIARDPRERSTQQRMLARRVDPVAVPGADRMPDGVPDPYDDGTESR